MHCRWVLPRSLLALHSAPWQSSMRQRRSLVVKVRAQLAIAQGQTLPQTVRALPTWVGAVRPSTHRGPSNRAMLRAPAKTHKAMRTLLLCPARAALALLPATLTALSTGLSLALADPTGPVGSPATPLPAIRGQTTWVGAAQPSTHRGLGKGVTAKTSRYIGSLQL